MSLFNQDEAPPAINCVNVTKYKACDPAILWLVSCGYRIKFVGDHVLMVREL